MANLNTSRFNSRDAVDIGLQRTSGLLQLPYVGSISYRAWTKKFNTPLYIEAFLRRNSIIQNAVGEISDEFELIANSIEMDVNKVMDIGCGHGIINYFFYQTFGCDLHLVDIERTDDQHHYYKDKGAGYGSLKKARQFLEANGVPAERIQTTNPNYQELADENLDVIISLLSCGFHYPVFEYAEFAKRALRPGGLFIFDMRDDTGQEAFFEIFPNYSIIKKRLRSRMIAAFA